MQIDIDAGNTRFKCRTSEGLNVFDSERGLLGFLSELPKISRVRIASVRKTDLPAKIEVSCSILSSQVFVARTLAEFGGLKISYSKPESMGVDRWLAMLAAKQHFAQGCIVVDAGSALTIDVVTSQGKHEGGYILPGLQLLRRSLFANTDKVIFDAEKSLGQTSLGDSTQACVDNGVLMSVVALIDRMVSDYPGLKLVFSGGDCPVILPHISHSSVFIDELVLDGLLLADNEDVFK